MIIAYDHLAAAQQAMRLLAGLGRDQPQRISFQAQPWRFDLLADADWAPFATQDALQADLLVISTSTPSDLPAVVQNWVRACLAEKRGTHTAVVALFDAGGCSDARDSSNFRFLQGVANEAGVEFFSPLFPRQEAEPARASSVTAALQEIRSSSSFKLSHAALRASPRSFNKITPSHWGINE